MLYKAVITHAGLSDSGVLDLVSRVRGMGGSVVLHGYLGAYLRLDGGREEKRVKRVVWEYLAGVRRV